MLTLHPEGFLRSGRDISSRIHVWMFKVGDLPVGEEALIAEFDHRWRYLRTSHDHQGKWIGEHQTPEGALEALQDVLKSEGHSV